MGGFYNDGSGGSPLTIKDEGVPISTNVTSIDFTGSGVTGSAIGDAVTEAITGGGLPGGSDTQVQFNDSSVFGGDSDFTFNKSTKETTVGQIVATTPLKTGGGSYGSSILTDGGLEIWSSGVLTLDNWTVVSGHTEQVAGNTATYAAQIVNDGSGMGIGLIQQAVNSLTPADTYNLDCYATNLGGSGNFSLFITDATNLGSCSIYNFTGVDAGTYTALSGAPTSDQQYAFTLDATWQHMVPGSFIVAASGSIVVNVGTFDALGAISIDTMSCTNPSTISLADWVMTSGGDGNLSQIAGNASTYAVRLTNTSGSMFGIYENITVTPATNYDISIDHKSPTPVDGHIVLLDNFPPGGGTNAYNFTGVDAGTWTALGGPPSSDQLHTLSNTTSWVTDTLTNIPGPANGHMIAIFLNTTNADVLDLDNASLTLSAGGSNLYTNGNFETWSATNIIVNPDFENWTSSGQTLTDWALYTFGGAGAQTLTKESTIVYAGTYAAHITTDPSTNYSYGIEQNCTGLSTGDFYKFVFASRDGSGDTATTSYNLSILNDVSASATQIWNWSSHAWESYSAPPAGNQILSGVLTSTYQVFTTAIFSVPASGSLNPVLIGVGSSAATHNIYFDALEMDKLLTGAPVTLYDFRNASDITALDVNDRIFAFQTSNNGSTQFGMNGLGKILTSYDHLDTTLTRLTINDAVDATDAASLSQVNSIVYNRLIDPGSGGILARTGTNTVTPRTLQTSSSAITIANPDGVSGDPNFTFDPSTIDRNTLTGAPLIVSSGGTGVTSLSDLKIGLSLDNVTNDAQLPLSYLDTDPTLSANSDTKVASQRATKAYADAIASGVLLKRSCIAASVAPLDASTYSNGASGVGATLTSVIPDILIIDGITVGLNDRVLIKDQVSQLENGIYVVTTVGDIATPFVLTRSPDSDTSAQIINEFTFVISGTVNANFGFVDTNVGSITIGTDAITYTEFSHAGAFTAGYGLTSSGSTINVDNTVIASITYADGKVPKNATLTPGSGTKFTVDVNGLMTAYGNATTSDIAEGTNLYYTDARARNSISSISAGIGYSASTGQISLNTSSINIYTLVGLPLNNTGGGTGTGTNFTSGSVVYQGSGAYGQDNANFFWDASNHRLGIGTATPNAKLHVVGNATVMSGNLGVGTTSPTAALHVLPLITGSSGVSNGVYINSSSTQTGTAGYNAFLINHIEVTSIGSGVENIFNITAGGAPGFLVDVYRNVLIGQATHTDSRVKVDILSSNTIAGGQTMQMTIPDTTHQAYFGVSGGVGSLDKVYFGARGDKSDGEVGSQYALRLFSGYTEHLTLLANGKVGIGVTTPTTLFHVYNTAAAVMANFQSTDTYYGAQFQLDSTPGSGKSYILVAAGHANNNLTQDSFAIYDNANLKYRMVMTPGDANTCKFGFNQPNPTANFHTAHYSTTVSIFTDTTQEGMRFQNLNNTNNNWSELLFTNAGNSNSAAFAVQHLSHTSQSGRLILATGNAGTLAEAMRVTENSNVLIGTTTEVSGARLVVTGGWIGNKNPEAAMVINSTDVTMGSYVLMQSNGVNVFSFQVGGSSMPSIANQVLIKNLNNGGFTFVNAAGNPMRVGNNMSVSIGPHGDFTTNGSAYLHLKAGTATGGTAPLKLTAGTNLSVVENGAIEFDGTHLYITIAGSRITIV